MDVSHRGGQAGFVRVAGDRLDNPDFRGSRYFNTFGNLVLDGRCGLLFADFATGDVLQLQGRAEIDWADAALGAERSWHVHVTAAWRRPGAIHARWHFGSYAPQLIGNPAPS